MKPAPFRVIPGSLAHDLQMRLDPAAVMARAGMPPDDWQRDLLRSEADRLLLMCARQTGKRLAADTPIATPTGWTTMGELALNDTVFDEQGHPCRVTWAGPVEHAPAWGVRFSDGSRILADPEHLWTTLDKSARVAMARAGTSIDEWPTWRSSRHDHGARTLTTAQIRATVSVHAESNHSVPAHPGLDLPDAELPIDPYVLGVWLGDGHSASGRVTKAACDIEIIKECRRAGYVPELQESTSSLNWNLRGLCEPLRALGLLGHKHIPPAYLRASSSQRLALLQGLMDTDGYASKARHWSGSRCELTTVCERLATDAYELLTTLGIIAKVTTGRAMLNGEDCGPKWRITFTPPCQVFRLKRKAARLAETPPRMSIRRSRFIRAVEPLGIEVPMRCIRVDSPSGLFLAGRAMVPTHNSTVTAAIAYHECSYTPGSLVLLLSPSLRQSQEVFRKVTDFRNRLGDAVPVKDESALRVEWTNGSRIVALPGTEETIRGFSGVRLLIVDEAARVPDPLYYAIRPMLAVSGGRIILLTTPFGKRGFFHDEWTGTNAWERVKITARDCPRISPAFLEEERNSLGDYWFKQEYLCEAADTTDQFFRTEDILNAFTDDVEPLFPNQDFELDDTLPFTEPK